VLHIQKIFAAVALLILIVTVIYYGVNRRSGR
jgi:hypothetical protein